MRKKQELIANQTPPRNTALSVSITNESDISLANEEQLLQGLLAQATADTVNVSAAVAIVDAMTSLRATGNRLESLYHMKHVELFIELVIDKTREVMRQRKKRFGAVAFRKQLQNAFVVPTEDSTPMIDNLILLRRLTVFTTGQPGMQIALCHSVKKLLPLVVSEEAKAGRLLNATAFRNKIIKPSIQILADFINTQFSDEVSPEVTQEVSTAIANALQSNNHNQKGDI